MTAKEYLQQAYYLEIKIKTMGTEIEKLRSLAINVKSMDYSEHSHSGGNNYRIDVLLGKMSELEDRLISEINKLVDLRKEISERIDGVKNITLCNILICRYLNLWKWEYTAVNMGYDYRHVIRLHGKALAEFQALYATELQ
jgi:hypothetical protein